MLPDEECFIPIFQKLAEYDTQYSLTPDDPNLQFLSSYHFTQNIYLEFEKTLKETHHLDKALQAINFKGQFSKENLKKYRTNQYQDVNIICIFYEIICFLFGSSNELTPKMYNKLLSSLNLVFNRASSDNPYEQAGMHIFITLLNNGLRTNDFEWNLKCILATFAHFHLDRAITTEAFPLFYSFLQRARSHREFNLTDHILSLLQHLLNDERELVTKTGTNCLVSIIQPSCINCNRKALHILADISKLNVNKETTDMYKYFPKQLLKRLQESPPILIPEELKTIHNIDCQVDFEKRFDYKFIDSSIIPFEEGISNFPHQFYFGISNFYESLSPSFQNIMIPLSELLRRTDIHYLYVFFNELIIQMSLIPQNYYFDSFLVFLFLIKCASNKALIDHLQSYILNNQVLNPQETAFGPIELRESVNTCRIAIFDLLLPYEHVLTDYIIHKYNNTLIFLELLSRGYILYNRIFANNILLKTSSIAAHFQTLSYEIPSSIIASIRSASLTLLANKWILSVKTFENVEPMLRFIYEPYISQYFINIFNDLGQQTHIDNFTSMFDFFQKTIKSSLETPKFLDITINLMQAITNILGSDHYPVIDLNKYFTIIISFLNEYPHYQIILSCLSILNYMDDQRVVTSLEMKHIVYGFKKIRDGCQKIFKKITNLIGEGNYIRKASFLPYLLLFYGPTKETIGIYIKYAEQSFRNILSLHEFDIDYMFIQLFEKKGFIEYKGIKYDMKLKYQKRIIYLLKLICSQKSSSVIILKLARSLDLYPIFESILSFQPSKPTTCFQIGMIQQVAEDKNILNSHVFHNDFTITFWLKSNDDYIKRMKKMFIIAKFYDRGTSQFTIALRQSYLYAFYQNGRQRTSVELTSNVTPNRNWNHFTIIFKGSTNGILAYIGLNKAAKADFIPITFQDGPIIANYGGFNEKGVMESDNLGLIGDVNFYNRELSIHEIMESFNSLGRIYSKPLLSLSSLTLNNHCKIDKTIQDFVQNEKIINLIMSKLTKKEIEKSVWCHILNILKIAFKLAPEKEQHVYIDPLISFVSLPSNFSDVKLYKSIYSIFEEVKNPEIRLYWFDSLIFKFSIWSNYANFASILNFWSNQFMYNCKDLISKKPYFSQFLETFNSYKENKEIYFHFLNNLAKINLLEEDVNYFINIARRSIDLLYYLKLIRDAATSINQTGVDCYSFLIYYAQSTNVQFVIASLEAIHQVTKEDFHQHVIELMTIFDERLLQSIFNSCSELLPSYPNFISLLSALALTLGGDALESLVTTLTNNSTACDSTNMWYLFPILCMLNLPDNKKEQIISIIVDSFVGKDEVEAQLADILNLISLLTTYSTRITTDITTIIFRQIESKIQSNFPIRINYQNMVKILFLTIFFSVEPYSHFEDLKSKKSFPIRYISDLKAFVTIDFNTIGLHYSFKIDNNLKPILEDRIMYTISLISKISVLGQEIEDQKKILNHFIDPQPKTKEFMKLMNTIFDEMRDEYSYRFNSSISKQLTTIISYFHPTHPMKFSDTQRPKPSINLYTLKTALYKRSHHLTPSFLCPIIEKKYSQHYPYENHPSCLLNMSKPSSFQMNDDTIHITTNEAKYQFENEDIVFAFKRDQNTVEIILRTGKSFLLEFESNSKYVDKLARDPKTVLAHYQNLWKNLLISNFKYIMVINYIAGTSYRNPEMYPFMPLVLQNESEHHYAPENVYAVFEKPVEDAYYDQIVPEYYYYFENQRNKSIFEIIYKRRKDLEKCTSINKWLTNTFKVLFKTQHPQRNHFDNTSFRPFKIKIEHRIRQIYYFNTFYCQIQRNEKVSFLKLEKSDDVRLVSTHEAIEHIEAFPFFPLSNGVSFYDKNNGKLIILEIGNKKEIDNFFMEKVHVAGSTSEIIFSSSPTVISSMSISTLPFSTKNIYFSRARFTFFKCSAAYNAIALACDDCKVRIRAMRGGHKIGKIDLGEEAALDILITNSWGFVFVRTKTRLILATLKGEIIKSVHFENQIDHLFSFESESGFDFIVYRDSNQVIYFFEAMYPERQHVKIIKSYGLLEMAYDIERKSFLLFENTGDLKVLPVNLNVF